MKYAILLLSLCFCSIVSGQVQDMGRDNPELNILYPQPGMPHIGMYIVEYRNLDYKPELATNAGSEFAVGHDKEGGPLIQNEGHLHGWVFKLRRGNMIRKDRGVPSPSDYFRFYGAGNATTFGGYSHGVYVLFDDLPKGKYRVFFQAQQNDHTAMRQSNAPAFPAISVVDFYSR